jgi:hypothetical protein
MQFYMIGLPIFAPSRVFLSSISGFLLPWNFPVRTQAEK